MSTTSVWIHGTSVQAEREGYFVSKRYRGDSARFYMHGEEWFHFAIPTPVVLSGQRMALRKIYVLYSTIRTAKIMMIRVFGHSGNMIEINSPSPLGYSGDHYVELDAQNSWEIPSKPLMKFGLGLSILVNFGPPSPVGVPEIRFYGAGADFESR